MAELLAVVGQHRANVVGHSLDQGVEEGRGDVPAGFRLQLGEGELRGPVDGDEEEDLALFGPYFGDLDVEVADGVIGKALYLWLVALHLGQAAHPLPFEAAVQRRFLQCILKYLLSKLCDLTAASQAHLTISKKSLIK